MILSAIFIPVLIVILFAIIRSAQINFKNSTADIIVTVPKMVMSIGIVSVLSFTLVVIGFTLFSEEKPHIVFYLIFGLFIWLGTFLIIKTLMFKVIVTKNKITVFPVLNKSYSFTFDQIVSATRQTKNNQVKSERIVIKTDKNKKLIVESSELSYKKFKNKTEKELNVTIKLGY